MRIQKKNDRAAGGDDVNIFYSRSRREKQPGGLQDAAGMTDPVQICVQALDEARRNGYEVILVDTAGRLAIDTEMMDGRPYRQG